MTYQGKDIIHIEGTALSEVPRREEESTTAYSTPKMPLPLFTFAALPTTTATYTNTEMCIMDNQTNSI